MIYLTGVAITIFTILMGIRHLGQDARIYFDYVGFTVVVGGTASVAFIVLPWEHFSDFMVGVRYLLLPKKFNLGKLARECLSVVEATLLERPAPAISTGGFPGEILRDGAEMIQLGFPAEQIATILNERIHQRTERAYFLANSFKGLAKYPPAFGLTGTVLSLVSLMRTVAKGANAAQIGTEMSIALVATFYGLLVANLIVNPAGESIAKAAAKEKKAAELALQGVLLASERVPQIEAQELLNSFVNYAERIRLQKRRKAA